MGRASNRKWNKRRLRIRTAALLEDSTAMARKINKKYKLIEVLAEKGLVYADLK